MRLLISLILPTLGNRVEELKRLFKSLEAQTYKDFEVIIVSQGNHGRIASLLEEVNFKYTHVHLSEKGLSNARNIGLNYIQGDIITFSDDDCWYLEESFNFVQEYFERNNSEIMCFQHFDPLQGEFPKKYPKDPLWNISKLKILSQASIDIFINRNRVKAYNMGFDTRFGLGGKYNSGEENIYLMDLKNKGYKIDYFPKIIAYHPNKEGNTSGQIHLDTFIGKAPLFKRLFGNYIGIFMLTAFAVKKRKKINPFMKSMYLAIKEYYHFNI